MRPLFLVNGNGNVICINLLGETPLDGINGKFLLLPLRNLNLGPFFISNGDIWCIPICLRFGPLSWFLIDARSFFLIKRKKAKSNGEMRISRLDMMQGAHGRLRDPIIIES